jgi:hypothetical protein
LFLFKQEIGWIKIFGATLPIPQGSILLPPIKYEQQKDMADETIQIDLNLSTQDHEDQNNVTVDSCSSKDEESDSETS